jgi:hypothetical protein
MAKREDSKKTSRRRRSHEPSSYLQHLIDLYLHSKPYRPLQSRRGYKSRLYSPSRRGNPGASSSYRPKTAYTPRIYQRSEQPYRPPRKQTATRSSYQPWHEPSKYVPMMRVQPDVEQTIKKLEKRLEKVLKDQVHESLESELEELKAVIEGKGSVEDTQQQEIENTGPEIGQEQEIDFGNPDAAEPIERVGKSADETNPKIEVEAPEPFEKRKPLEAESEDEELHSIEDLYNEEEELDWLREELDDADIDKIGENTEALTQENLEPISEQPISPLETLEPKGLDALGQQSDVPLNDFAPLETIPEIGPEQMADLEPLLNQIEPLEIGPALPIEATPIPGILPELMPENIEESIEEAEAVEGQGY